MDAKPRSKLNAQIYEEASSWFVESRAGDLDDAGRREFDRWLRRSPEHLSAYLEIAALWSEGGGLDPAHKWDAGTLVAQAAEDPGNIVPLSEVPRDGSERTSALAPCENRPAVPQAASSQSVRRTLGIRRTHLFGLAASVATFAVAGGAWLWFALSSSVYTTAIGEQRSLVFADGSTVEMNSRSKIHVRYSERERAVDLLEGQALFHVAKDHSRPFIVSAQGTRVRAVGTQFDVYERRSGTVVTVVEGQVAVLAPAATGSSRTAEPPPSRTAPAEVGSQAVFSKPASPAVRKARTPLVEDAVTGAVLVSAGEQVTVTQDLAQIAEHANIAAATAWTERRLVFESATLSDVAEEFNRYNRRQLIIQDPDLYGFHISGVFSSTDPDSLIRFLRNRAGVRVTETNSEIRVAKNI